MNLNNKPVETHPLTPGQITPRQKAAEPTLTNKEMGTNALPKTQLPLKESNQLGKLFSSFKDLISSTLTMIRTAFSSLKNTQVLENISTPKAVPSNIQQAYASEMKSIANSNTEYKESASKDFRRAANTLSIDGKIAPGDDLFNKTKNTLLSLADKCKQLDPALSERMEQKVRTCDEEKVLSKFLTETVSQNSSKNSLFAKLITASTQQNIAPGLQALAMHLMPDLMPSDANNSSFKYTFDETGVTVTLENNYNLLDATNPSKTLGRATINTHLRYEKRGSKFQLIQSNVSLSGKTENATPQILKDKINNLPKFSDQLSYTLSSNSEVIAQNLNNLTETSGPNIFEDTTVASASDLINTNRIQATALSDAFKTAYTQQKTSHQTIEDPILLAISDKINSTYETAITESLFSDSIPELEETAQANIKELNARLETSALIQTFRKNPSPETASVLAAHLLESFSPEDLKTDGLFRLSGSNKINAILKNDGTIGESSTSFDISSFDTHDIANIIKRLGKHCICTPETSDTFRALFEPLAQTLFQGARTQRNSQSLQEFQALNLTPDTQLAVKETLKNCLNKLSPEQQNFYTQLFTTSKTISDYTEHVNQAHQTNPQDNPKAVTINLNGLGRMLAMCFLNEVNLPTDTPNRGKALLKQTYDDSFVSASIQYTHNNL